MSDPKTCFRCGKTIKDERAWIVYHGSKYEYECFDCSPKRPPHQIDQSGNVECTKCGDVVPAEEGWITMKLGEILCRSCNAKYYPGTIAKALKPTLGVTPYSIWLEKRIVELAKAIESRSAQLAANPNEADPLPLSGWAVEIVKLQQRLKKGEL